MARNGKAGGAWIGLDLAWSPKNPSGVAAIDGAGSVLDLRGDLVSDDEIVHWVRTWSRTTAYIGIDMPTIVRNAGGQRDCERELRAAFQKQHAGPHPANLRRFPDGGRARRIIDALASDGFSERIDLQAKQPGRFAFEVYPHPALVRLFSQPAIYRYKKKTRPWPAVLAEWSRLRGDLATLAQADPPLVLEDALPARVEPRGYKAWEDRLDALVCAYVAAFVYRYGMHAPHVRVFGDLAGGYIIVPDRPVGLGRDTAGTLGP